MTIFNCKVEINGEEHHNKDYKSLKEISNELKLSYQQVADLSINRVKRRTTNNFIFHPIITISKVNPVEPVKTDNTIKTEE